MKTEKRKTQGKDTLSVEVPTETLARFREYVRSRGGRMGFEVSWLLEGLINGSIQPPTHIQTKRKGR